MVLLILFNSGLWNIVNSSLGRQKQDSSVQVSGTCWNLLCLSSTSEKWADVLHLGLSKNLFIGHPTKIYANHRSKGIPFGILDDQLLLLLTSAGFPVTEDIQKDEFLICLAGFKTMCRCTAAPVLMNQFCRDPKSSGYSEAHWSWCCGCLEPVGSKNECQVSQC